MVALLIGYVFLTAFLTAVWYANTEDFEKKYNIHPVWSVITFAVFWPICAPLLLIVGVAVTLVVAFYLLVALYNIPKTAGKILWGIYKEGQAKVAEKL